MLKRGKTIFKKICVKYGVSAIFPLQNSDSFLEVPADFQQT